MKHTCSTLAMLATLALAPLLPAQQAATGRTEQGDLIFDGIPARDPAESAALARWLEARSAALVDWLADGSLVVSTRAGNTAQLHRVRTPLATPEQFTFETEPVTGGVAHPYDTNLLLYLEDRGGGNTQIRLRNLGDNTDRLLADGKSVNGPPVFARDGKRIAFYSNARDGVGHDIYVSDITGAAAPQLLLSGGSDVMQVQDWSLDDQRLAVIRYTSSTDSQLLIADVATGALTRIEPAPTFKGGTVSVAQAQFSRDGRGLYFLSDRGGEFMALHYIDLQTNVVRTLTPDTSWNVERFALSLDGRFIAWTRNEGGIDRLVLHDLRLKTDLLLPPLPAAAVIGTIRFDRTGQMLAVGVETALSPPDIYVYRITAGGNAALPQVQLARWTRSEPGPIDAAQRVPAKLVEFPTWDDIGNRRRMLSAFVYRPQTPGPHPVIIDLNEGPDSQYRPQWNAFTQYLVNELGYAVVAPNVRGSSGYGRSFLTLDDGALREDPVRDIGALLVWMGAQREFSRNKVVVMGGSHGGHMTLAAMVNYSDRLAGGVDAIGSGNFAGFLSNAASITRPLLLVQGLNDPAVPASEAERMMAKVRANGAEVWYLAAKDAGRGFRNQANRDIYLATVSQFLQRLAGR